MAIATLGVRDLFVGNLPVIFDPFPYNERRAYRLELQFISSSFTSIFSTVVLQSRITPTSQAPILDSRKFSFDILSDRQILFYPLNRLVNGNGDVTFMAERIPVWRGAGDGQPVALELFYDDSLDIQSWID